MFFYIPYPKLGLKALKTISDDNRLLEEFNNSIKYNKEIGNIYTGSLFLSLISLMENSTNLKHGDEIGMYSYGSGAVSEFFKLRLVKGYEKYINKKENAQVLKDRIKLSVEEYEKMFLKN